MAQARLRTTHGTVTIPTRCGPIEYQERGRGVPLLMIHGSGGGHDQGMAFARSFSEQGMRVIAPSRFGYLSTPRPVDASLPAQADAHACLLDALGIEQAAVMGVSAGAPSALQLALRHAQRASALVLVVPILYKPDELADSALADAILPVSSRAAGLRSDTRLGKNLKPSALETVRTPTLLISARDDGFGTYANAQYTASKITNAKFIGFEQGGHLLVGHDEATRHEIAAFVLARAKP